MTPARAARARNHLGRSFVGLGALALLMGVVVTVVEVTTVKSHLACMLPKLGVRSRLQAVVWAYQRRIVEPTG